MPGRIAVVDENNRFLRWEERPVIHAHRLPHRSVQVFLFDTQGRLVLQRRHQDKQTWPRAWDISASGHVDETDYPAGPDDDLDAVYAAVAHRELAEELGVETSLQWLHRSGPEEGVCYEHYHVFQGVSDGPYVPQPDEVEDVLAVTREELALLATSGELVTPTLLRLVAWLGARGLW